MGDEVVTKFDLLMFFVALSIPAVSWLFWVVGRVKHIVVSGDKLLDMHEHPEGTGFGTVGFEGVIEDNTRAIKELTHYVRWVTEKQIGSSPPPYVGD